MRDNHFTRLVNNTHFDNEHHNRRQAWWEPHSSPVPRGKRAPSCPAGWGTVRHSMKYEEAEVWEHTACLGEAFLFLFWLKHNKSVYHIMNMYIPYFQVPPFYTASPPLPRWEKGQGQSIRKSTWKAGGQSVKILTMWKSVIDFKQKRNIMASIF